MADVVTTHLLSPISTATPSSSYAYQFNNISDGTGESGVIKIDKSALQNAVGTESSQLRVRRVEWYCQGMDVDIYWDHSTDVHIITCSNSGYINYSEYGGLKDTGTGGTGDIIFTTRNHTSGDSYVILIKVDLIT